MNNADSRERPAKAARDAYTPENRTGLNVERVTCNDVRLMRKDDLTAGKDRHMDGSPNGKAWDFGSHIVGSIPTPSARAKAQI